MRRVYLILHHVLKELSSKRLIADQKNFAEVRTDHAAHDGGQKGRGGSKASALPYLSLPLPCPYLSVPLPFLALYLVYSPVGYLLVTLDAVGAVYSVAP